MTFQKWILISALIGLAVLFGFNIYPINSANTWSTFGAYMISACFLKWLTLVNGAYVETYTKSIEKDDSLKYVLAKPLETRFTSGILSKLSATGAAVVYIWFIWAM